MKKITSVLLSFILLLGVLAGCSGSQSANGSKDGKKVDLRIWSFTDELKKPIKTYEKKNGLNVELTIVPIADYPTKLKPVLESGVGAPDVFTGELAFIKQWVDAGYWENLSKSPYNADKLSDKYVPYVFDLGKDKDGNVRALSWQTTPGGIYYKRSMAKEVLGTDDPQKVGEMMSSMDKVFQVADKMKAKGYRMFPDEGSIRWFSQGDSPEPWVNAENELKLTDKKIEFMDYAKKMKKDGYTANAAEWSPSWFESMDKPVKVKENGKVTETKVFSYVLPTWGLHSVLKTNVKKSVGDWAVTSGPSPYFWGGTWLGVYSKSKNKKAAYDFVKMMTQDDKFLKSWAKETGDVLSYQPVTNAIKDDFSDKFLGGQNNYQFFLDQAHSIKPGIVTKYDQQLDTFYGNAVKQYTDGKKSKKAAVAEFYQKAKNAYPELNVPKE
ncbi:ABC transporter substrate-binding protein [Fictibacillus fluitans]|uniref:ABC transporter substrate-binding protein n=1 Tax=Fictibacillus fluitans TaxID=3058422 RepID=A0ABT8HWB2_9BACL|nr:ABC transporter substrate-binding protein [Fictibacillus sp. NE201]MDN4525070.1 ABC transporter substrate-binding protein [Fictibacillus sp. NE201]